METRTRKLRPIHIAIIAILFLAITFLVAGWFRVAPSLVGQGPKATTPAPSTTPQEARARSEGRSRDGANSSQDAYTSQNQSRNPDAPKP